jgi:hypothetical protein
MGGSMTDPRKGLRKWASGTTGWCWRSGSFCPWSLQIRGRAGHGEAGHQGHHVRLAAVAGRMVTRLARELPGRQLHVTADSA